MGEPAADDVPEPFSGADFQALVHTSDLCVLVHEAETKRILWANPAACELLEFTLPELLPLTASEMSSAAAQYDRVIGRAWLQEAVERGRSRIEWHYRTKSGRVIPTDALAVRVELARGPVVLVQFRDIERELRMERELRRTVSYIDGLGHRTATMALMLDEQGVPRFATESARRALGAPAERPVDELLEGVSFRVDARTASWAELAARATPVAAAALDVPQEGLGTVRLEGGLERLDDASSPIGGEPGAPEDAAFLMLLHDVSERVADERRRERELQREHHLARYTAMGDLAMAIAHELGQPIAAAGNFLAAASGDDPATASRRAAAVEHARRQVDRAGEILTSLRAFVGYREAGELVADLREVVAECRYFAELRASAADVRLEFEAPDEPVLVQCARVLTGQVVLNLCFNAIDELAPLEPARRVVRIAVSRAPGEGRVTVSDRGPGLGDADPFAEPLTTKEAGNGIGLSLSRRIVERQRGSVWAADRPGGGAEFGFALPAAPADRGSR